MRGFLPLNYNSETEELDKLQKVRWDSTRSLKGRWKRLLLKVTFAGTTNMIIVVKENY